MLHLRESDCDFHTHLHNGDSLAHRTHNVPANRPPNGTPPFSFEYSACDALRFEKLDKMDWKNNIIERIAYCSELFNGFGYRFHNTPSAYLWAGTNQYKSGKFVSDGVFNANVVDTQLGCMAVLKYLLDNYVEHVEADIIDTPISDTSEEYTPPSPKAKVDRPTDSEMNEVSRKHWYSDWLQWLGFGGAGTTAAYKAADSSGIEQLQPVIHQAKYIATLVGASGLLILFIGLGVWFMYSKKLQKDDVVEGRYTPSGEVEQ
jgi:hypothetical protein